MSALAECGLESLHGYWQDKRRNRIAPRRDDINPGDLRSILPNTFLVDVIEQTWDFRYRLWGTGLREAHGLDMTGRSVKELLPQEFAYMVWRHYVQAAKQKGPVAHIIAVGKPSVIKLYSRILLPLSEDGERINMIFGADGNDANKPSMLKYFSDARALHAI